MTIKIAGVILAAVFMLLTFVSQPTIAQEGTANRNATVKGQMKQSGREVRNAGAGLGTNVRHGRVVRGGKHFGKHMYRAGKHFGKGSGLAAKRTGRAVKNAAKPD
jgi:hypothetical protein